MRQLPVAILKATALGLIAGPVIGLLLRGLNWLIFGRQPFETPGTPLWFLHAVWSSGVYAVTFYVFCALPAQFVRR